MAQPVNRDNTNGNQENIFWGFIHAVSGMLKTVGGKTTKVVIDDPTHDVTHTIPAKAADDTFVMLSDLVAELAEKISQGGDSFGATVTIGSNDGQNMNLKGGGITISINSNGFNIPDGKRIGNMLNSDVWRIYVGTATTEASWRRNTPDNFAAMVTENANSSSTGDMHKWRSNIGGTTATRAAVRKDGRIWAQDGTEINDLATLGQIQAAYVLLSAIGSVNGVASLDETGKVPSTQLPSYVDDVLEYPTFGDFPASGETGKIYVALDTNLTYRWGGSSYVEISQSLALGETSSTAYRGDRGKTAYDHSNLTSGNPHNVTKSDVGLSAVDNTSDADKPISTLTQAALDDKVEIGGDLGGTITEPTVEKITGIAEETETVVATVLPDGTVQGEQVMQLWVDDDTATPYTLATLVSTYPTSAGYLRGFEVRCRNLTNYTVYRKTTDNDDAWKKIEWDNVT